MKKRFRIIRILPVVVCVFFMALCAVFALKWDFEDVLAFTPDSLILAAFALWIFYALKSLSIMFPATVFFIAAGHIYPYPVAVAVNIVGLAISFLLPYLIGKVSGGELAERICKRYPKAGRFINYGRENNFFTVYASRAVTVLPNDLCSMIHGAVGMPLVSFLFGSLLGILPEMLVETYIGGQLSNLTPKSILVMIMLIILTASISFFLNKSISKKQHLS